MENDHPVNAVSDPLALFGDVFAKARASETADATALALATVSPAGHPSVRMVLLKGADQDGFVFFTNYESRKARDLQHNSAAALCFYWPSQGMQVRVEGRVSRVSAAESDAYFATRPRESQIGAWASPQSAPLASREELVRRFEEKVAAFGDGAVSRPPHWGGFRLRPDVIEFWYAGDHRLHDRIVYTRTSDGWSTQRLAP